MKCCRFWKSEPFQTLFKLCLTNASAGSVTLWLNKPEFVSFGWNLCELLWNLSDYWWKHTVGVSNISICSALNNPVSMCCMYQEHVPVASCWSAEGSEGIWFIKSGADRTLACCSEPFNFSFTQGWNCLSSENVFYYHINCGWNVLWVLSVSGDFWCNEKIKPSLV